MMRLTKLEAEMVRRAMEFIDAGEWPWTKAEDGTTRAAEARERAAWKRAQDKLNRL